MARQRAVFSMSRVIWVLTAIGTVLLGMFVGIFVVPEVIHWREREGIFFVASPAVGLATHIKRFKEENERYPRTMEEYMSLRAADNATPWVQRIMDGSRRMGRPLTDLLVPTTKQNSDQGPLVVISGESARVEVYPPGGKHTIGISRCFLPANSKPSGWLVLPNESWQQGANP